MEIKIKRIAKRDGYTIGKMSIGGKWICDTLEDTDRGLKHSMSAIELSMLKKAHVTAIPTGRYIIAMNVKSPRFGEQTFYKRVCKGFLPRLVGVPAFNGVLIHCGNTAGDTDGCILVGENKEVGKVLNSRNTFTRIMSNYFLPASKRGEKITITIE